MRRALWSRREPKGRNKDGSSQDEKRGRCQKSQVPGGGLLVPALKHVQTPG